MPVKVVNKRDWKGNGIYIGRSTRPIMDFFGNPFSHLDGTLAQYKVETREESIEKYRDWALEQWREDVGFRLGLTSLIHKHLRGEEVVLACFCKPLPCHGDILKMMIEEFAAFGIVTLPERETDLSFLEVEGVPD